MVNRIFREMGKSNSGHVCHIPQHASTPVYVSDSGASSNGDRCSCTRLAGEVDVHVSTVSPAHQSHSESKDHLGGRGTAPRWLFHIYYVCVRTTLAAFCTAGTYCHNRGMSPRASHTVCTLGGSHAALPSSRIFKRDL